MSDRDQPSTPMSAEEQKAYQARQKHRAIILAALLGFMVVLFYLITIVKIGSGS
ncbi:hypothetical protein [Sphingorhabdus sp. 109]|jgi:hypothetical protein|uniref:hypothetical protein n=1 Tax=Sphingorhabdus sp. 109 TaxID=2653173 RepID=UPI0012EF1F89|nr:hypothetical protein [Sphingorhabdus sp. 109]VWX59594.1 Cytochrome C oxidase assembly protein [Sphingorhabdus sp. 109]